MQLKLGLLEKRRTTFWHNKSLMKIYEAFIIATLLPVFRLVPLELEKTKEALAIGRLSCNSHTYNLASYYVLWVAQGLPPWDDCDLWPVFLDYQR